MRRLAAAVLAPVLALLLAAPAGAHHGEAEEHRDGARAEVAGEAGGRGAAPPTPEIPLPVEIVPRFDLTDHRGRRMTEADLAGRMTAIFFGYASCEAICSVALPRLAAAIEGLGAAGDRVTPLVITVDPARDTVESMGPALAKWSPRLIGLTGSEAALAEARAAFQVEAREVFRGPDGQPVYAHGSFIYLVGPEGRVLTLMPPVLSPERMTQIIAGYL